MRRDHLEVRGVGSYELGIDSVRSSKAESVWTPFVTVSCRVGFDHAELSKYLLVSSLSVVMTILGCSSAH